MNAEVFLTMQTPVALNDVALRVSAGIKPGRMSGGGSFSSHRSRGGLQADARPARRWTKVADRRIGGLC